MTKIDKYKSKLEIFFNDIRKEETVEKLNSFLISNSNLPGRRANLELASAYQKLIKEIEPKQADYFWKLLNSQFTIDAINAPTNDPKEFIPFCATWGIGSFTVVKREKIDKAIQILKGLSKDQRWRMREAVAKGYQEI